MTDGTRADAMPERSAGIAMDISEIMRYLPHRYPFLLLDRVTECVPGEHLKAYKNVSANEPFFQGHFPGQPVMPGVLILEAMAQATGVFAMCTLGTLPGEDSIYYFVGVDGARFRKPVLPGDRLEILIKPIRHSRGIWKVAAQASVDGVLVCSGTVMGALRDLPA